MAPAVEFHTGVPDTQAFACRLLRKAYRRGVTVLCIAPADRLEALDRALWTFVERDFVPHAKVAAGGERMLKRTPVWLSTSVPAPQIGAAREVVLNLGGDLRVGDVLGARVLEVVGADADEVERGRALWREYKVAGFDVIHHPFKAAREE